MRGARSINPKSLSGGMRAPSPSASRSQAPPNVSDLDAIFDDIDAKTATMGSAADARGGSSRLVSSFGMDADVDAAPSKYLDRVAARSEALLDRRLMEDVKKRERRRHLGLEPRTNPMLLVSLTQEEDKESPNALLQQLERGAKKDLTVTVPSTNEVRVYRRARTETKAVQRSMTHVRVDGDLLTTAGAKHKEYARARSVAGGGLGDGRGGGLGCQHNAAASHVSSIGTPLPPNTIRKPCEMAKVLEVSEADTRGALAKDQWATWVTERQTIAAVDPNAGKKQRRRIRHHRRSCKYHLFSTHRGFRQLSLQTAFPNPAMHESLDRLRHMRHGASNGSSQLDFNAEDFFAPMTVGWWEDEDGGEGDFLEGGRRASRRGSMARRRSSNTNTNAKTPGTTPMMRGSRRTSKRRSESEASPSMGGPAVPATAPEGEGGAASAGGDQHHPAEDGDAEDVVVSESASDDDNDDDDDSASDTGCTTITESRDTSQMATPQTSTVTPSVAPGSATNAALPKKSPGAGHTTPAQQQQQQQPISPLKPAATTAASAAPTAFLTESLLQQQQSPIFVEERAPREDHHKRPGSRMSQRCKTPDVSLFQPRARPHTSQGEYHDCSCTDRSTDDELEKVPDLYGPEEASSAAAERLDCWRRGFAKTKVLARSRLESRLCERRSERAALCDDRRHFSALTKDAESQGKEWRVNRQTNLTTPAGASMWHTHFDRMGQDAADLLAAREAYVALCDACVSIRFPATANDEALAEEVRGHFVRCQLLTPEFVLDLLNRHATSILSRKPAVRFLDLLRQHAAVPTTDFLQALQRHTSKILRAAKVADDRKRRQGAIGAGSDPDAFTSARGPIAHEVENLMKRLHKLLGGGGGAATGLSPATATMLEKAK